MTPSSRNEPLFAVLGVGDHSWADTYQAVPKIYDERLTALGGRPLVPRAAADTSGDLTGTARSSRRRCGRRWRSTTAIRMPYR